MQWIILGTDDHGRFTRPHPAVMSAFESYREALEQTWYLNEIYHTPNRWRVFSAEMARVLLHGEARKDDR